MMIPSKTLAQFLEPTLFALRQPTEDRLRPIVDQVLEAELQARASLRQGEHPLDPPSFELGVAHALAGLLTTAEQRSVLNDAIRAVRNSRDLDVLHQIAVVNRAAEDGSQKRLAELLGADPGNLSRRVGKLVELGLVAAEREGRSLRHSLTPLGLDVLAHLRPGWRALHPITGERVETEREAKSIANQVVSKLLGQEASGILGSGLEKDMWRVVVRGASGQLGPVHFRKSASYEKPSAHADLRRRASVMLVTLDERTHDAW